jgi:nitrogenase molybdenum-iron protein beta chain
MASTTFIEKPRYSCALGGALAVANALPRTVAILHASVGCGGMNSASLAGAAGWWGSGYCGGNSLPASGISEKEIVFGGAERLAEQITNTAEVIDADLFIVITGCTSEIIGDDVPAVVRDYNETRTDPAPVIFASGAGFKGNSYFGYDSVLQSLFRDYVEPVKEKKKKFVNVWGITPGLDVFWEGNLLEIRRLLEALGLTVNSFFTQEDSLETIRSAAQAELNIVVSFDKGIEAAKVFEEVHQTPYLALPLPIGAKATDTFLRNIAKQLELNREDVDAVLRRESDLYYRFQHRLADAYSDIDLQRYAVIIGDSSYAHALTEYASEELGWIPKLVVITDELQEEQKEALYETFAPVLEEPRTTVAFETDTSLISNLLYERWPRPDGSRYYRAFSPAFVLGSRIDKDFADSIKAGHLSVTYPVSNRVVLNRRYAGYTGGLQLAEDIFTVILQGR